MDDAFFRQARTRLPDGTWVERPWTKRERYELYARGFRDGAGTKPMRKGHIGLEPYDRGYGDGVMAARAACAAEAARLGYKPTILRIGKHTPDEGGK